MPAVGGTALLLEGSICKGLPSVPEPPPELPWAAAGALNPHEGSLNADPLKAALRQAGALQLAAQVGLLLLASHRLPPPSSMSCLSRAVLPLATGSAAEPAVRCAAS